MWEGPYMEHMTWGRFWTRMSGGKQGLTYKSMPRQLHGYIETQHPRTDELLKWFPYKNELSVNDKLKPTFSDILHTYYWPATLDDAQRVSYVAEKTGRTEEEIASNVFKMRRLKMGIAQSIRMKLRGKGLRVPHGNWDDRDSRYLAASGAAAQALGMSFYNNPSFEPTLIWSNHFQFGDCIDMLLNKPLRTSLQYCLVEVCVHKSIPRCRLADVKGSCKFPLDQLEPCLYEELKMKLSVMAYIARKEAYVVDTFVDGGHRYLGCIMHFFEMPDDPSRTVNYELESVDLDLDLAEKWLFHYHETVLGLGQFSGGRESKHR